MRRLTRRGVALAAAVGTVATFAVVAMGSVGAAISPASGPASASQYERKVTICHRTGSARNPFRTIRVSRNAVPAHLRHGDALGPCSTATFTMCHTTRHGGKATVKVRGARRVQRAMRRGDKLGKCKAKKTKPQHSRQKGKNQGRRKGPKK